MLKKMLKARVNNPAGSSKKDLAKVKLFTLNCKPDFAGN
jgi:hypothetical protein